MPELPEVETIKRGLSELIVGYRITNVTVLLPKIVKGDVRHVLGASILGIRRRGKGLLLDLDNNYSIAIHVKMTGQLIFRAEEKSGKTKVIKNLHPVLIAPSSLPNKWTHVVFRLAAKERQQASSATLFYNDIRQFGWIHILPTTEVDKLPFFSSLGPEPLGNLSPTYFQTVLSKTKAPIKIVLMDQARFSGIGNIYANDALFSAKIHPLRPASSLSDTDQRNLFEAIEHVLTEGIKAGGASEENFVNALGEKGFYQERFLVYKKNGKPCPNCGTLIERIVVGGRGTFFCSRCQQ